jgi:arylsulfatase A-like enzyme
MKTPAPSRIGTGKSLNRRYRLVLGMFAGSLLTSAGPTVTSHAAPPSRPNLIVIYTDDHRADGLGFINPHVRTPNLDRLANGSVHFSEAFVVSSLCSPSRAQLLTGRYSSQNGVAELPPETERAMPAGGPRTRLNPSEPLIARLLADAGYFTGIVGKWHIDDLPVACGFEFVRSIYGNGPYADLVYTDENGRELPTHGYVERVNAEFGEEFLRRAAGGTRPFFLFYNSRVPHMDHRYAWPVEESTRRLHPASSFPLPATVGGSLDGKPPYLGQSRSRTQALHYGYADPARLQEHQSDYYSAISELDAALGAFLGALEKSGMAENTYVVLMGDNGWFLGEHLFTSKVLAYEASIRVPLLVKGPGISPGASRELILNIDVAPTLLEWAGVEIPAKIYGRSFSTFARNLQAGVGRDAFLYEMAPAADTARNPFIRALRTKDAKLIRTYNPADDREIEFVELYNLADDPHETTNLASSAAHARLLRQMNHRMDQEIAAVAGAR